MSRIFTIFCMFWSRGSMNKKNIIQVLLLGVIANLLLQYSMGVLSVNGVSTFLAVTIPFLFLGQTFTNKQNLTCTLAWDSKKHIQYSLLFFLPVSLGIYYIISICNFYFLTLYQLLLLRFKFNVDGQAFAIVLHNQMVHRIIYANPFEYLYDFMLLLILLLMYFPLFFARQRFIWWNYMLIATASYFVFAALVKNFIVYHTSIKITNSDYYLERSLQVNGFPLRLIVTFIVLIITMILSYKIAYRFHRHEQYQ